MSSPICSGTYIISNVALCEWAGHQNPMPLPTRLPIIGSCERQIWVVENVEGDMYMLCLHQFVTVAEKHHVWSYLGEGVMGTKWMIRPDPFGDKNHYIISDPERSGRWALREKGGQVSLESAIKPIPRTDPEQLWMFTPLPIPADAPEPETK
ncbi:hypothetical protein F5148DRAFT_1189171 [Russula earlei]|uniref:Uncharacterized protein n=1 Tax=Russula earlei TaxID=71964 RepID=A0ACC0UCQ5_9AGAM|nr:hypothetical protein F5148DRAFT_1189171 [Russula earlei]